MTISSNALLSVHQIEFINDRTISRLQLSKINVFHYFFVNDYLKLQVEAQIYR